MTAETVISRPRRAALLAALLLAAAPAAHGAVLTVTKPADTLDGVCDSDCSLRDAVVAANARRGRDVIVLPPGVYRLSRAGSGEDHAATGDLDVRYPLTVIGAGADKTAIDGGGLDRVFDALGASLELLGLAVQGGRVEGWGAGIRSTGELGVYQTLVRGNAALGKSGEGGGLWIQGDLVMHESTVAENLAEGFGGGGILTLGEEVLLNNSTISGNRAPGSSPAGSFGGFGGGLFAASRDVIVSNTTITGNVAVLGGGYCVFEEDGPSGGFPTLPPGIGLRNSILAGNTAAAGPDCSGSYTSDGYNLIGNSSGCHLNVVSTGNLVGTPQQPIDPRLGPLADNGGPTPTHALLPGSPALDAGSPKPFEIGTAYCQAIDQRGQ
ncbi:MAG TPA: CSLREA domain-containing protein, partial [Thermoanaerobaculia bacterium]